MRRRRDARELREACGVTGVRRVHRPRGGHSPLIAVNQLLGFKDRVAMTNRPDHSPNEESNEQIYRFFEFWLKK